MCAGSAQVTLSKRRESYNTGCSTREDQAPKTRNKHNQTPKSRSNLLRNSCDHGGRMRRGETGAMNSTKLSVVLDDEAFGYLRES